MNSSVIAANLREVAVSGARGAPDEKASSGAMSSAPNVAQANDSGAVPIDIAIPPISPRQFTLEATWQASLSEENSLQGLKPDVSRAPKCAAAMRHKRVEGARAMR
jgi:hypothetical protein